MAAINIKAFRGQVPRVSDRLLQGNQATRAVNCKITSGRLDPLSGLQLEASTTVPAAIRTLFRYRFFANEAFTDYWLTFTDDVDVVESPLANDPQGRLFYTSEVHEPRMTTHSLATSGSVLPAAWYALGVPNPTQALSVSVSGGTTPTESRSYVYTFVTALGEESGPSPASTLTTGNANGTWNLSGMQTAPPNSGTVTAATANTPSAGMVRVTLDTTFGLEQYDTITLAGVVDMTDLNGSHRIQAVNGNQVDVMLTTAQTYTSGGTWARNAPINTTGMVKRIYRTAGLEGQFLYVAEVPVANTTYADTVAGTALGETLTTLNTLPPPKNLTSLISLPNGCLVGVAGNELCFSDPYMPYSWPEGNRYSFSGRGVALCPAGNSVIVLTDSFPILFTGSDPEAMSPSVMETYAPCVSKRGVVYVGAGCLYPSFDGLWLAAPGRVENIVKRLYREQEWAKLNPASFDSVFHDGQYYGAYQATTGEKRVWVLDVSEPDSVVEVEEWVGAWHRNEYDGRLYLAQGSQIFRWDGNPARAYESDWISATYQLPRPTNFAVAQVHADFSAIVPVDNSITQANEALMVNADNVTGELNANSLLEVQINGSFIIPNTPALLKKVQFTLYADGLPVFTKAVTSSTPFRLPAGYRSEVFNIGLDSSVPTYSITVAESTAELAQASA